MRLELHCDETSQRNTAEKQKLLSTFNSSQALQRWQAEIAKDKMMMVFSSSTQQQQMVVLSFPQTLETDQLSSCPTPPLNITFNVSQILRSIPYAIQVFLA